MKKKGLYKLVFFTLSVILIGLVAPIWPIDHPADLIHSNDFVKLEYDLYKLGDALNLEYQEKFKDLSSSMGRIPIADLQERTDELDKAYCYNLAVKSGWVKGRKSIIFDFGYYKEKRSTHRLGARIREGNPYLDYDEDKLEAYIIPEALNYLMRYGND